jgi:hypothetical protein
MEATQYVLSYLKSCMGPPVLMGYDSLVEVSRRESGSQKRNFRECIAHYETLTYALHLVEISLNSFNNLEIGLKPLRGLKLGDLLCDVVSSMRSHIFMHSKLLLELRFEMK